MDDKPLNNMRHESFCQLYSSSCFGNAARAYREAGYKPKTDKVASADSARLIANGSISERIACLRSRRMMELAIDATRIMELRLKCAYDPDAAWNERLAALRDIEKALGLNQPEKVEHSMTEGTIIKFVHTVEDHPAPARMAPVDAPKAESMPTPAPATPQAVEAVPEPSKPKISRQAVIDWSFAE